LAKEHLTIIKWTTNSPLRREIVFPWLEDGGSVPVSGADTIDELNQLHQALLEQSVLVTRTTPGDGTRMVVRRPIRSAAHGGPRCPSTCTRLGVVEQTLFNWVKAHRAGTLKGVSDKATVSAEQMEISRLRAELARVTMERDILGKATAFFARGQK
jgi:transposase